MIEQPRVANDNGAIEDERPVVSVSDDRPDHAYARRGNLILPLRFAQLMPEWSREESS